MRALTKKQAQPAGVRPRDACRVLLPSVLVAATTRGSQAREVCTPGAGMVRPVSQIIYAAPGHSGASTVTPGGPLSPLANLARPRDGPGGHAAPELPRRSGIQVHSRQPSGMVTAMDAPEELAPADMDGLYRALGKLVVASADMESRLRYVVDWLAGDHDDVLAARSQFGRVRLRIAASWGAAGLVE